jgi:glycosyltransferase involved in cell wall biosynthesis
LRIFFAQADTEGCAYYRTYLPGIALAALPGVEVIATHEVEIEKHVPWADVIVWQRQNRDELLPARELARKLGKVQVYEIDDLMDEIPEWSPQYAHYPRGCRAIRSIHEWMRACDHLIVSTEPLGRAYHAKTGTPWTVSANALDFSKWIRKDRSSDRLRIGWTGSTTHQKDLAEAQYAVFRVLEEHPDVDLVMMGYDGGWKHRLAASPSSSDQALASRIDYYPWWADAASYPRAVADLRIDVAIAPLAKNAFNRCRSNVKLLEFAALGVPVVASAIEPYAEIEDGVTGMLARDGNDFHRKLDRLVTDEALRKKIGEAARGYVRERYDIRDAAWKLLALFQNLTAETAAAAR